LGEETGEKMCTGKSQQNNILNFSKMKKKTIGKMLTFKEPSVIINSDMREFCIESKKPLKAVKYT